jgi:hypothetical protein
MNLQEHQVSNMKVKEMENELLALDTRLLQEKKELANSDKKQHQDLKKKIKNTEFEIKAKQTPAQRGVILTLPQSQRHFH